MAIQLRRGNESDLDISRLHPGEAAVCLDTGKFIVKLTGGNYLTLSDTSAIEQALNSKADDDHDHDERYYTETEIDNKLSKKQNALTAGANVSIETVNGVLTISAADTNTTYTIESSGADNLGKGQFRVIPSVGNSYIVSINGLQAAAYKTVGTGNDQVAAGDHNHDGTYAAASHSHNYAAPNHNHDGTYAPASHSHNYAAPNHNHDGTYAAASHSHTKSQITDLAEATASAAGLLPAADKAKIDSSNAGIRVQFYSATTGTDLVSGSLNTGYALANFSAIEIRYCAYRNGNTVFGKTLRLARVGDTSSGVFGNVAAEKYEIVSNVLTPIMCGLSLSGSTISLANAGGASEFIVYQVWGYK